MTGRAGAICLSGCNGMEPDASAILTSQRVPVRDRSDLTSEVACRLGRCRRERAADLGKHLGASEHGSADQQQGAEETLGSPPWRPASRSRYTSEA